ncbi:MAG: carboxypeptidase regulatory-like domain-containing protein, partial [Gemmatimonas sp.]
MSLLTPSRQFLTAAALLSVAAVAPTRPAYAQQKTSIRDRATQDAKKPAAVAGIGVIDGIVTDTLLRPLGSADVSVIGVGARVVTEESGRFRFLQVPAGQYLLVVRRIGFAPTSGIIDVPADDTLRLSYILARTTNLMDTVRIRETRVSLRMLEFDQRRIQGVGQFITQEQIERRGSRETSDFLRTLRGVD